MRRALAPLAFAAIISVAVMFPALASVSAQELRGSLLVEVRDSSNAAVPAAHVTLHDEQSAARISVLADLRGEARFPALFPATYSVEVSATGLAPQTQRVAVAISAQPLIRFALAPESLRQSVEVRDRGPSLASHPLDTANSIVQTVITSDDRDEVPLSARHFANISLMAPFTSPLEPPEPTKAPIPAASFPPR